MGSGRVQAILFDLGVSSVQLDEADRGFAYAQDAPLDMRMDPTAGITAAEVVNTYPGAELTRILREYGEERFAQRIARAAGRRAGAAAVHHQRPAGRAGPGGHPGRGPADRRQPGQAHLPGSADRGQRRARRPATGHSVALQHLSVAGRIVVMSYQSLEDRIVKRAIAPLTVSTTPVDLPIELPGHEPEFRWLDRGPEIPDRRRDPGESPGRVRAAAGGRAHQGGGIVTNRADTEPDQRDDSGPAAVRRGSARGGRGRSAAEPAAGPSATTASSRRAYERRHRRRQKMSRRPPGAARSTGRGPR